MRTRSAVWLLGVVLAASAAYAANQISRSVNGAGGAGGAGATNTVLSTAGQPVVGTASATTQTIRSGFWTPLSGPSAVDGGPLPAVYRLAPPVPNPFHGELEIEYDVPAPGGIVSLRLYDISGRLIKTFVHGPDAAGRKRLLWNGRDDAGNQLPLGVYLLSLDAPHYNATRKVVLVN